MGSHFTNHFSWRVGVMNTLTLNSLRASRRVPQLLVLMWTSTMLLQNIVWIRFRLQLAEMNKMGFGSNFYFCILQ
jgi:hypothetical protein